MKEQQLQTKSPLYLHFYGFLLSSTGWFFGYGIAMFNTFFDQFIQVVYGITDSDEKIAVSGNLSFFFLLGGLICCITCGKIIQSLGRYRSILIFQALSILCVALELIHGLQFLYALRVLHGYLACSYTFVSVLMMTENLPVRYSKIWSSAFYIFLTGGILTSYLFSTQKHAENWRLVFAFPIIFDLPRLLLLLLVYRMESPVWLYETNKDKEEVKYLMEENFRYIYPQENAVTQTQIVLDQQQKIDQLSEANDSQEEGLLSPAYRRQFLMILYLNFLNQMTGINFLVFYSTDIYKQLNLSNAESLTFYMGFVNFSSGFAILLFTKFLDLKEMLVYGLLSQSIGYFIFLIGFTFENGIAAVVGTYLFMFSFGCSMGGSLYPYQTLVLPARGVSIASISQWFMACLVGKYALVVVQAFGIFYTFYFFMFMAFVGSVITAGYAVQVGGKTKFEIQREFIGKKFFLG